jgi:hypothetical protein
MVDIKPDRSGGASPDGGRQDAVSSGLGRRRRIRRVLRITGTLVAFLLIVVAGVVGHSTYRRHAIERKAIRRLQALDASFGRQTVGPEWLNRVLRRCNLPVLTSLGGVDQVNPEFCDSDLALLRYSSRIGNLDLDRTQVTDAGMVYLKGLTKITTLELNETRVTDAGLAHLKVLTGLRVLTLRDTSITDAGLAHLAGLSRLLKLDVTNTRVTDAGLEHLVGLTGLETVVLEGTRVTEDGIARLKQALPNVEVQDP